MTGLMATVSPVEAVAFAVPALAALAGALGVVMARQPVHSALNLVLCLFSVAVLFVDQGANFLGAVQVIVYAGAIVVLFLFVIMMLGVDRPEPRNRIGGLPGQLVLGVSVAGISLVEVILLVAGHWTTGARSLTAPLSGPGSAVVALAQVVFTTYLLPFEATALLLVVAVVGAVVLTQRTANHRSPAREEERS
jgi:NADH-quinone oxidoreductase subunit J